MTAEAQPGSPPSVPDAAHGRLAYFAARIVRPFALAAPIAAGALVILGEGEAWEGAVAAALIYAVIAYRAARWAVREAREAFFASYASLRGLEGNDEPGLPAVAPLLSIGDDRHAERGMTGTLPGGLDGVLALYTYEDYHDGDGRRARTRPFTVVVHHLPEVTERILQLYCEPRSRARSRSGIQGFRRTNRLQLESVALDRCYEIFFGPGDDENWLHQLYTPTFIVWLAERAPSEFGFQLSNGYLCAFVPGHQHSAARLDGLCEAAAMVGRRVVEEAGE